MTAVAQKGLDDAALRALVSLLDEEDENARGLVESRLREALRGEAARVRRCAEGLPAAALERLAGLERSCALDALDARWRSFAALPDLDLEAGLSLLCAYADPALDPARAVADPLDALAEEMRWARTPRAEPLEVLHRFNDALFIRCGFKPDAEDPHHPDNARLDRTLARRRGSPLMLALLCALLARRLELPLSPVCLPGRVLAVFDVPRQRVFMDPARGGLLLTPAECEQEAERRGPRLQSWQMLPSSPRTLLGRSALALAHALSRRGERALAERIAAAHRRLGA